jgi:hypothetical protein
VPQTCRACSSSEREAIDKALVAGEPLRNIAKRVSISPAGLLRHKAHVAGTIARAQERREEKLGDSIFDEMRRVLAKLWELSGKAESEGDHRGAIVGLRAVRECLESLNNLVTKAEGGANGIAVTVKYIGTAPSPEPKTRTAPNNQRPAQPAAASRAVLPASSPTDAGSQPGAIVPRKPRPVVGAVGYLQGFR